MGRKEDHPDTEEKRNFRISRTIGCFTLPNSTKDCRRSKPQKADRESGSGKRMVDTYSINRGHEVLALPRRGDSRGILLKLILSDVSFLVVVVCRVNNISCWDCNLPQQRSLLQGARHVWCKVCHKFMTITIHRSPNDMNHAPESVLRLVRRVDIFIGRVLKVKSEVPTLSRVVPELQEINVTLS